MTAIFRRPGQQFIAPVKINWAHPLARGLRLAFFGGRDYVSGQVAEQVGGSWGNDFNGRHWVAGGDGTFLNFTTKIHYTTDGYDRMSVVALGDFASTTDSAGIVSYCEVGGGNYGWVLKAEQWANSGQVGFTHHGTAGADVSSGIATPVGYSFIGVAVEQAGHQFLINDTASSLVGPDLVFSGEASRLSIGRARGTVDPLPAGDRVHAVFIWEDRTLTLAELRLFRRDPYAVFTPVINRQVTRLTSGNYSMALTEALSASDAATVGLVRAGTVEEVATAAEAFTNVLLLGGSIAEAISAAEAAGATVGMPVIISEGVTSAETVGGSLLREGTLTEPATATDSSAAVASLPAGASESASLTESLASALDQLEAVAEAASAVDSQASERTLNLNSEETAAASDLVASSALMGSAVTEASSAADAQAGGLNMTGAVVETSSAAESVEAAAAIYEHSVTEAVSTADSQSAVLTLVVTLTEASTAGDSQSSQMSTVDSVGESLSLAELSTTGALVEAPAGDAVSVSESVSAAQVQVAVQVETVNAADAQAVLAALTAAVTEAVSGTEVVASTWVTSVALAESVVAGELSTTGTLNLAEVIESASAADAQEPSVLSDVGVAEAAAAGDQSEAVALLGGAVSETATTGDQVSSLQEANLVVLEPVSALDSVAAGGIQEGSVAESVTLLDVLSSMLGEFAKGIQRLSPVASSPGYVTVYLRPVRIKEVIRLGSINSFGLKFFTQGDTGLVSQPLAWVTRVDIRIGNEFSFSQYISDIDKVITWNGTSNEVTFTLGEMLEADGVTPGTYNSRVTLYGSQYANGLVFGVSDQLVISVKK